MNAGARGLAAVLLLVLGGCAKDEPKPPPPPPPPPPPTLVVMSFESSLGLNPDITGRASPALLRLYELSSLSVFANVDFYSLYDRDAEVLGQELVGREVMKFRPGEKRRIERALKRKTRYIGVMVAYRDLEHAGWRAALEVPLNQTTPITIKLDRLDVSMEAGPAEPAGPALPAEPAE